MRVSKIVRVEAKVPEKYVRKLQQYADKKYNGNRGLAFREAVVKFAKEL